LFSVILVSQQKQALIVAYRTAEWLSFGNCEWLWKQPVAGYCSCSIKRYLLHELIYITRTAVTSALTYIKRFQIGIQLEKVSITAAFPLEATPSLPVNREVHKCAPVW